MSPTLSIQAVGKSFPGVKALSNVSVDLPGGEILSIVGENGAGKSTLLKILSGDYTLDEGSVELSGKQLGQVSPLESRSAGFRLVRQEPEIVPFVSVLENIFIGEMPRRGPRVDFAGMRKQAEDMLKKYGFSGLLDLDQEGRTLSPAQTQLVEILRALKPGARVVAFDEPTSSLTLRETERLFDLIRKLREEGMAIVYVSHRLHEIMEISDRVFILKDGEPTGDLKIAETNENEIISLMVGRELDAHGMQREPIAGGEVVLEVRNLSSQWHDDISFDIRAGEIVGFAGLVGAGRTELAKVIFGEYERMGGTISIAGEQKQIHSPADAIRANIGLAPEDRKGEGLILVRSVIENACMAVFHSLSRFGFLRQNEMLDTVRPLVDKLEIKTPTLETEVGKLSGGNQQKVVLARWLAAKPRLLILDEPTRAVDVGAKAEIYRLMDDLARSGLAIMMISSEMPELLAMSDRIFVMQGRKISQSIPKSEATEERIVNLALGTAQ